jgi:hypothetical protein
LFVFFLNNPNDLENEIYKYLFFIILNNIKSSKDNNIFPKVYNTIRLPRPLFQDNEHYMNTYKELILKIFSLETIMRNHQAIKNVLNG